MNPAFASLIPVVVVLLVLLLRSFGINQEYQRGVLFRLGRLGTTKGPGWFWRIPLVDRVKKIDIATLEAAAAGEPAEA